MMIIISCLHKTSTCACVCLCVGASTGLCVLLGYVLWFLYMYISYTGHMHACMHAYIHTYMFGIWTKKSCTRYFCLFSVLLIYLFSCRTCHKIDWGMSGESSLLEGKPGFAMDFNFFVEDKTVVIDEADVREQQGYVRSLPIIFPRKFLGNNTDKKKKIVMIVFNLWSVSVSVRTETDPMHVCSDFGDCSHSFHAAVHRCQ